MPERPTLLLPPVALAALLAMTRLAVLTPTGLDGVKRMATLQAALGMRLPQVLAPTVKSLGLAPVRLIAPMFSAAVPELVTLIFCAALLVPSTCSLKVRPPLMRMSGSRRGVALPLRPMRLVPSLPLRVAL